jgi:16S rRNA (uracil1498-N3)-methyltransferase
MQKIRLYVERELNFGAEIILNEAHAHYLRHVMRLKVGEAVFLFNGRDGEWRCEIKIMDKKSVILQSIEQSLPQNQLADIWLLFAPIKAGRLEFLVEKATELGVTKLLPVKTNRTIIGRVNVERLQAHAIEAAEQSGRLQVPEVLPYQPLNQALHEWVRGRKLIYGDESGNSAVASKLLAALNPPLALLIGPEGGFAPDEFAAFKQFDFMMGLNMGQRIMRADTAAIAGLTLLQNYCGDWR